MFKDLLAHARAPSAGGGRLVLYSLIFALPLLGFAWAVAFVPGPARFATRPVFLGVCVLLAFFHLAVAVPAATAFALERDRDTLDSLVASPLSPWRLVLGKLGTALTIGLLGKMAALPALGLAYVLGGADLGFLPRYLVLLFAVDLSLAAFALNMGARRRDVPSKIGWIKAQTTQTQMALQATVGISVLASLIPIYTIIFLLPLALQFGNSVADVLDLLAPLGALHPLAALVVWGDADLFGLKVPVWLLGVILHTLIALPLLADCAEAQRSEGSAPGRQTRLMALPVLAFLFLLIASVAAQLPQTVQVTLALLMPTLLVFWVAGRTGFGQESRTPITRQLILRGLWPARALESTPGRAPGFVLLLVVLAAPLLLWAGGGGGAAFAMVGALGLVGTSIAALGARLTARVRERGEKAFLEALDDSEEDEGPDPEQDSSRSAPRRVLLYLLLGSTVLPLLAGTAIRMADQGSLPALASLRFLFPPLAALAIALNPFASLLPVLANPDLVGSSFVRDWLLSMGLDPWALFILHVVVYGLLLIASLVTLREPADLEAILAKRRLEAEAPA